jgi:hypothetical protein
LVVELGKDYDVGRLVAWDNRDERALAFVGHRVPKGLSDREANELGSLGHGTLKRGRSQPD